MDITAILVVLAFASVVGWAAWHPDNRRNSNNDIEDYDEFSL